MKRVKAILLLLLLYGNTKGQTFAWQSRLDTVTQNGFYCIALSADWLVKLKPDLSDIRIMDEYSKPVSFIIKQPPHGKEVYFVNVANLKSSTDSADGYSYIWMHQSSGLPVDSISISIIAPKFYEREASIYDVYKGAKNSLLATSVLRSGMATGFWIRTGKLPDFLITIKNGDNPPLTITTINTYCKKQQLIAYLERGKTYFLFGGNPSLTAPAYDLTLFRDSIPHSLTDVKYGALVENNQPDIAANENVRWWLWPVIVGSLVVLLFITIRLMKEMK